ncbi:MAG: hypothetical protein ACRD4B_05950, partial [Acidobacteriota bacterium]
MKKQKLQNPSIDTPSLEPSLYESDLYVKVKDTNHFVQLAILARGEKASLVDQYLLDFEALLKLVATQAITRGLEQHSKIDTPKSIEVPIHIKEKMSRKEEFERNVAAFKAMERQLENDPHYNGKYVVIYKGQLVASGDDRSKLLAESYQKYGYVSLIVHKIG